MASSASTAPAPSGATYGLTPSGATVGSPGLPAAGRELRALALPGTAQTGRSGELHLQHWLINRTVKFKLLICDSEEIKLIGISSLKNIQEF